MKKIVDQIRLSSAKKKKIFFKKIKIKWFLVESKHHYYEIKIDQKSILKVKCKGVIVTKRLLNDFEEERILGYLNDLNLKLPLPDSSSLVCPNINHKLEITIGEFFLTIAWCSNDEIDADSVFRSIRELTDYIQSIEEVNFGFHFE
jgi:hypothetical protein